MQSKPGLGKARTSQWILLLVILIGVIVYIKLSSRTKVDTLDVEILDKVRKELDRKFDVAGQQHKPQDGVKDSDERGAPVTGGGYATAADVPIVKIKKVNCKKIFDHDPDELNRAMRYQEEHPKRPVLDGEFIQMAGDCEKFRKQRQYVMKPVSKLEEDFSIAYSILMFKDVEQTERLLRTLYRPQNFYCIHVDRKSPTETHLALQMISKCFPNVFIASRAVDVQWAWFSVVEPELVCMKDLLRYKRWKYFINLTGQEFPLKTNLDLVKILTVYNGTSDVEGTEERRNTERTEFVHQGFWATEQKKDPPPHKIRLTKGSVHITVPRAFVDFVVNDKIAEDFINWVKDTGVPDETLFSSLVHSPHLGIPGAYKGKPETHPMDKPFMTRFKNWGMWPFDYPCEGERVRLVCVFGVGDLRLLSQRPELFANKFYLKYHSLAYDCMEELLYNRTREEIAGRMEFDVSYYKKLSFVKNHV